MCLAGDDGNTPLLWACASGRNDIAEALLAAGSDPADAGKGGLAALHVACSLGHESVTATLLEFRAEVALRDGNGWLPLHHAAAGGFLPCCQLLLLQGKANPNAVCLVPRLTAYDMASQREHITCAVALATRGGLPLESVEEAAARTIQVAWRSTRQHNLRETSGCDLTTGLARIQRWRANRARRLQVGHTQEARIPQQSRGRVQAQASTKPGADDRLQFPAVVVRRERGDAQVATRMSAALRDFYTVMPTTTVNASTLAHGKAAAGTAREPRVQAPGQAKKPTRRKEWVDVSARPEYFIARRQVQRHTLCLHQLVCPQAQAHQQRSCLLVGSDLIAFAARL